MSWDRSKGLRAFWSKRERDVLYEYCNKPDGHLLHDFFSYAKVPTSDNEGNPISVTMLEELERRGYDLTTLRFSIKKKQG